MALPIVVAVVAALVAVLRVVSGRAQAIVFAVAFVAFGVAVRDAHLGFPHGLGGGGLQVRATNPPARGRFDGGDHPAVGLLYGESGAASCSGTLVRSRVYGAVFLTAAHCQLRLAGRSGVSVRVTFEPAPSDKTVRLRGTYYADPAWADSRAGTADTHDVAVVLFDAAEKQLKAIEPMQLAPVGAVRSLLSYGSGVTVVGYGRTDPKRPSSAGIRHEGTMTVTGITDSYVTTAPGTTLTCEGDSGGPELVTIAGKEYVAAVNSLADADCAVWAAAYRVDTAEVRAFVDGPHPSSSS